MFLEFSQEVQDLKSKNIIVQQITQSLQFNIRERIISADITIL